MKDGLTVIWNFFPESWSIWTLSSEDGSFLTFAENAPAP